jgi:uncharacterized protein YicC (UPF0701 family)
MSKKSSSSGKENDEEVSRLKSHLKQMESELKNNSLMSKENECILQRIKDFAFTSLKI